VVASALGPRTVLDALLDLIVQAHTIAAQAAGGPFPAWLDERADALGERREVDHEQLKVMLPGIRLAVRTGEETPYPNVVLECGVPFWVNRRAERAGW